MMMKNLIVFLLVVASVKGFSQELYVFSEPASNMPAKSISFKFSGRYYETPDKLTQRYMPEVMFGINKNWMVHFSSTVSNVYSKNVRFESGRAYAKYRFLSNDAMHSHFRMAAFGDVAITRNPYVYEEVNLEGDNDGAQLGFIATQLVHKLAVSGTGAYTNVFRKRLSDHLYHHDPSYHMFNYSLSAGYLVLPKEYVDYHQTNLNIYLELLGMRSLDQKHQSLDLAPAVQLIFNSNAKLNLGYRFQLNGNMHRISTNSWQVSFERTILNAWK